MYTSFLLWIEIMFNKWARGPVRGEDLIGGADVEKVGEVAHVKLASWTQTQF